MTSATVPSGTRAAKAGATRHAEARVVASRLKYLRLSKNVTWPATGVGQPLHVMDEETGIGARGKLRAGLLRQGLEADRRRPLEKTGMLHPAPLEASDAARRGVTPPRAGTVAWEPPLVLKSRPAWTAA